MAGPNPRFGLTVCRNDALEQNVEHRPADALAVGGAGDRLHLYGKVGIVLGHGPDGEDEMGGIDGAQPASATQRRMTSALASTSSFNGPLRKRATCGAPCRISLAKSREAAGRSKVRSSLAEI